MYLCIQVAGFDAILDWHLSILYRALLLFSHCQVDGMQKIESCDPRHILRLYLSSACSVNSIVKMTYS